MSRTLPSAKDIYEFQIKIASVSSTPNARGYNRRAHRIITILYPFLFPLSVSPSAIAPRNLSLSRRATLSVAAVTQKKVQEDGKLLRRIEGI
ncbi:hypothetical protein L3X38_017038 [Prunus dulcis]|uniref:Uncharacterized protein n=1 Tax=Prunus dulcis TaxID=3755 RepID=A0AAD4W8B9_PRUDU|nr:hypothetical protein L3X38_017038 [Prunus dulcis]